MQKHNGPASIKPIVTPTVVKCLPSKSEVEIAEQQRRYHRVLEILLKADLQVLADLSKQNEA